VHNKVFYRLHAAYFEVNIASIANIRTHPVEVGKARIGAPSRRWLIERLRDGRFPGRKIGREWRMTDEDIEVAIDLCKNDPQIAARPTGLTPRSRTTRQPSKRSAPALG
jgi:hypothetical protein